VWLGTINAEGWIKINHEDQGFDAGHADGIQRQGQDVLDKVKTATASIS
jgi:hypothetical protein